MAGSERNLLAFEQAVIDQLKAKARDFLLDLDDDHVAELLQLIERLHRQPELRFLMDMARVAIWDLCQSIMMAREQEGESDGV